MNLNKIITILIVTCSISSNAQKNEITTIEAPDGIHYLTNAIGQPIFGTYLFDGAEPIVELAENGTGFYQLHDQLKRPIIWGLECSERGIPISNKGFDNEEYKFWYQYTDTESDGQWNLVEFTIHFKSMKMYIQGERLKVYSDEPKKVKRK